MRAEDGMTREEAFDNFDSSTKWTVSLPEHEMYFDTQEEAERFAGSLKNKFPDLPFSIQRPVA